MGHGGEEGANGAELATQSGLAHAGDVPQGMQAVALEPLDGLGRQGVLGMQAGEEGNGDSMQEGGRRGGCDEREGGVCGRTQGGKLGEGETGADACTGTEAQTGEPLEKAEQQGICFGIRADAQVEEGATG